MEKTEQLLQWAEGISTHSDGEDRHTPDYSCCFPNLKAPKKVRKLYLDALNDNNKDQILFFEALFEKELEKELKQFEEEMKRVLEYKGETFIDANKEFRKKEET